MTSKLRRRRRVVVDDEQILAELSAEFPCKMGLEARSFEAKAALDASRFLPPDLLVANVGISSLMGFDLAIKVQEFAPGCKVLLFSTDAGTDSLLESVRGVRNDLIFLFGPVRLSELLEQVYGCDRGRLSRAYDSDPNALKRLLDSRVVNYFEAHRSLINLHMRSQMKEMETREKITGRWVGIKTALMTR